MNSKGFIQGYGVIWNSDRILFPVTFLKDGVNLEEGPIHLIERIDSLNIAIAKNTTLDRTSVLNLNETPFVPGEKVLVAGDLMLVRDVNVSLGEYKMIVELDGVVLNTEIGSGVYDMRGGYRGMLVGTNLRSKRSYVVPSTVMEDILVKKSASDPENQEE